jgi:hypothetical protein
MREETRILALLQVVVPANTLLTLSAEVKILEILGIVSNPELVKAMNLSISLIPPTTSATMKGLVQLLSGLIRIHPKSNKTHHATLDKLVTGLASAPDLALTFGTFLPICESLLKARHKLNAFGLSTCRRGQQRLMRYRMVYGRLAQVKSERSKAS